MIIDDKCERRVTLDGNLTRVEQRNGDTQRLLGRRKRSGNAFLLYCDQN